MGPTGADDGVHEERWQARPVLSGALRTLIVTIPILASVLVGAAWVRLVPPPADGGRLIGWWLLLAGASVVGMLVADRAMRRLLPLATLLRLTMAFPDRAPSRYRVARRVSTRDLEKRIQRARQIGIGAKPAQAAETILSLVAALSLHDRRTRGHSERVRVYTDLIAEEYRLSVSQVDRLRWASLLHDIGKLTVSTTLLNKPGKPTAAEWVSLRKHPEAGEKLIAPLRDWLGEWARAIPEHHEHWDGSGYPRGLSGEEISLAARIVSVADAYEVMTTSRPYSKPMSPTAARQELTRCAGTQFDPAVVRAFLNVSLGKLRWIAGPVSWMFQLPFVPRYQPLIPLNASVPATLTQMTAAGAIAMSPVADLPQRAAASYRAAGATAAVDGGTTGDGTAGQAGRGQPAATRNADKARNDQGSADSAARGAAGQGRIVDTPGTARARDRAHPAGQGAAASQDGQANRTAGGRGHGDSQNAGKPDQAGKPKQTRMPDQTGQPGQTGTTNQPGGPDGSGDSSRSNGEAIEPDKPQEAGDSPSGGDVAQPDKSVTPDPDRNVNDDAQAGKSATSPDDSDAAVGDSPAAGQGSGRSTADTAGAAVHSDPPGDRG